MINWDGDHRCLCWHDDLYWKWDTEWTQPSCCSDTPVSCADEAMACTAPVPPTWTGYTNDTSANGGDNTGDDDSSSSGDDTAGGSDDSTRRRRLQDGNGND